MSETASLSIRVTQEGAEQAAASLRGLTHAGGGAEASFGKLAMQIAGLNTGYGLAVQAGQKVLSVIKDLASQSVQLAASFEKSRITWGVLVGDMDKGSEVFDQIRQFAAETPLSFEGLSQAATTIKGFGAATDDLIPILSKLGDVAMGDNAKLQSLALVYGQVMAQGKAKTQDLYQFINAGVPIFNLLADSMNKSAGEIKELASEGAVTFEEIEKAITKATSAGGQFYGMMDKTAETTEGKWSTALDNWKASLADLGQNVLPMVNKALDWYNKLSDHGNANKNAWAVLTTGEGDYQAAREFLESEKQLRQAELAAIEKRGGKKVASIAYADVESRLSLVQLQLDQLADMERRKNARDALNVSGGQIQGVRTWQSWEAEVDAWVQKELERVENEAGVAAVLGRNYDRVEEHNKVVNSAIDKLLGLDHNQVDERFTASDRSVGELVGLLAYGSGSASYGDNPYIEGLPAQQSALPIIAPWDQAQFFQDENMIETVANGDAYVEMLNQIEKEQDNARIAADRFSQSLQNIAEFGAQLGQEAFIDFFHALGESMADSADSATSFTEAIKNIYESILDNMPALLFQAGIQAMGVNPQLGLGLIAASGIVAIGGGLYDSYADNAQGGVYSSRSISSYSGGIYDTPQLFNFARGAAIGRFGEAGPEAILPLTRTSTGALGVQSAGSGSGSITINVQNYAGAQVQVKESIDSLGQRQVEMVIEKTVKSGLASGRYSSYGLGTRARRST